MRLPPLLQRLLRLTPKPSWQYFMHPIYGRVRYDHVSHAWQRATIHGTWCTWHKPHCRYNKETRSWQFTLD